ncbi:DUF262 domain-containing protein [Paraburkholderia sediminicola]|uniref:DUF262 domain-containing protein n=1 Tax=Paraburkholderia sediminicola TaxID=458836 RepID=UPI0038B70189
MKNASEAAILKTFLKAQDRLVYQTADLSLGSLSGMATARPGKKSAPIDLDPDFQRRERWNVQKQSALIESFLLNVPVPAIYLAESAAGQYSVVDGKQRITAIHTFMSNGLRLKGLESFTDLEGLCFNELPEELRNALEIRPYVRVVTLLKQSDPSLKFEVFTRLNKGGEAMLPQELRKVAYRGALSDAIFELSKQPVLRKQLKINGKNSPPYIRMEDAEYVLRFFTLNETWNTFSGSLRDELDKFMEVNQQLHGVELKKLESRFLRALSGCDEIWGDHAFQRHTGAGWRSQFLAGMYDAEMLAVNLLTNAQLKLAREKRTKIVQATAKLFQKKEFEQSVRQGTNTPSFVRNRVNAVYELLANA